MMPTKNGDSPMAADASVMELTRISDIQPTAVPATASISTLLRTDQGPPPCKGLGAETGRLVLDAVGHAGEVSAAECAELVCISRVSARRYLEHYLGTGALELRLQYGVGRPERRYRLLSTA
jgi:response regulator of citrate/malate metabolism